MNKHEAGFTLIELLTVVVIVAILAMIAIPAYQDYTVRMKVAEALSLIGSVKLAVTETFQSNGFMPVTNAQAGVPDIVTTRYIESVHVKELGKVTIKFNAYQIGIREPGEFNMIFTPNVGVGRVVWDCLGGTLHQKYRPSICRS